MGKKLAFLFPGQASQYVGMGKDLYENFEEARVVFDAADQILGYNLSGLCFNGPEVKLNLTEHTQPTVLAVSIAAFEILKKEGLRPSISAGHSLGEYSALVASGTLKLKDALPIVKNRGKFMQEAVHEGEGAMAALIGIETNMVRATIKEVSKGVVELVNYNSPKQLVISGHSQAVQTCVEILKGRGLKKAVFLPVSAPFHSSLMKPAEDKLSVLLDRVSFGVPDFPIVANVSAEVVRGAENTRESLKKQVSRPVLWEQSIKKIIAEEVEIFVEVGPNKVLSGLLRQINKDARCLHVEDKKSLENTLSNI